MIMIRHGQSEFNVLYAKTRQDPLIRDPHITELGKRQAAEAVTHLKEFRLKRIISSPYSRTLQTASIIADALTLPISVDAQVGEIAASVGEVGSPVSHLSKTFHHVDFGDLPETWWPEAEEPDHLHARAQGFREKIRAIEDWSEVLVVTHWGFIRSMTGHDMANCGIVRLDPHADHPGGGEVVAGPLSC
ncbi:MAG: histidine phosphatase family protein [Alphaproteobacteria bacterium]